jgi:hypothetical protein
LDFEPLMRNGRCVPARQVHPRAARARLIAACATLTMAGAVRAQVVDDSTRSAARDLASQGKASYARGDYEQARDLFHRAYTLVPAPTISVNEARALVKLHRLVEAAEAYMRSVRTSLDSGSPEQFRKAVRDSEAELLTLRPRIPKLTIVAVGPGSRDPDLTVTFDGAPLNPAVLGVETPVDPGTHRISAKAAGGEEVNQTVTLDEKQKKRLELVVPAGLEPLAASEVPPIATPPSAPAAAPRSPAADRTPASGPPIQKVLGFVALGVGAAGLTTGIVTGLMAASKYSQAESGCPNRACVEGTEGNDALRSFRTLRTVSTVSYVVGGLGLAGGVTLILTAPHKSPVEAGTVHPWVGAGSAGVAGAF